MTIDANATGMRNKVLFYLKINVQLSLLSVVVVCRRLPHGRRKRVVCRRSGTLNIYVGGHWYVYPREKPNT